MEKADRQFAAWRAKKVVAELGLTTPPVRPVEVAEGKGIVVRASNSIDPGFSGCLMKQGDTFGILYTSRIDNTGFIHFTVAHELGHYFMEPHRRKFFGGGSGIHNSQSGFVSYEPFEVEADHFAAAFLMPESMFAEALGRTGEGIDAIEALHDLFCTSLTATAIRYAELSPDPVVVVVSEGGKISYAFASAPVRDLDGVWLPSKGAVLPPRSATAEFNRDPGNVLGCQKTEGSSYLDEWIDDAPAVEVKEDVLGLGSYGKTLTVLFADELPDPEGDGCEDDD